MSILNQVVNGNTILLNKTTSDKGCYEVSVRNSNFFGVAINTNSLSLAKKAFLQTVQEIEFFN